MFLFRAVRECGGPPSGTVCAQDVHRYRIAYPRCSQPAKIAGDQSGEYLSVDAVQERAFVWISDLGREDNVTGVNTVAMS